VRDFLLKTSILDELSAPLCRAVLMDAAEAEVQAGAPNLLAGAQALLEHLQRANLFVIPLDEERTSFRYHHLFADLLRRQLANAYPALLRPLHARASAWYEQQGLLEQATRHALAAGDYERSINLLNKLAEDLWARGELTALQRLIRAIPDTYRAGNPLLGVYEAGSLVASGHLTEAERCLEAVDGSLAGPAPEGPAAREVRGRAATIRVQIAVYRGDAGAGLKYARMAREHLPPDETTWTSRYAVSAANVLLMAGRFREGREQLARGLRAGLQADSPWTYLMSATTLGLLAWTQGRLHDAQGLAQEARAFLQAHGLGSAPIAGGIAVIESMLLLEKGRPDEAEALMRRALEVALTVEGTAHAAVAYMGMVLCCFSRADWRSAEEHIRSAELSMQRYHFPIWSECVLASIKARIMLRQGRLGEAEALLSGRGILPDGPITYPHQNEYLALATLLARQRRTGMAWDLLDRLELFYESSEMRIWLIPARLLRAQLFLADGWTADARAALGSAWCLAATLGHYLDFVQLDGELLALLGRPEGLDEAPEFVRNNILQDQRRPASAGSLVPASAGFHAAMPGQAPFERLSERELEVLRLIAAGLSNPEIAQRLHVELQTVKFHASNIYGKLAVENRVRAVARAQEQGILP
jgi:LuxR family maltose regulon positive regulatory protein